MVPLSARGLGGAVNKLRRKSSSGFQQQHMNISTRKLMGTKQMLGDAHLHSRPGIVGIV